MNHRIATDSERKTIIETAELYSRYWNDEMSEDMQKDAMFAIEDFPKPNHTFFMAVSDNPITVMLECYVKDEDGEVTCYWKKVG